LDGEKVAKFGIFGIILTKFALFDERKMAFLAAKSFGVYQLLIMAAGTFTLFCFQEGLLASECFLHLPLLSFLFLYLFFLAMPWPINCS